MKPRWKPSHSVYDMDRFIGYVEEFDIYLAKRNNGLMMIIVVASEDTYPETNFDAFEIVRGELHSLLPIDLNVTPYHMCLLYALAIENGIIKGED